MFDGIREHNCCYLTLNDYPLRSKERIQPSLPSQLVRFPLGISATSFIGSQLEYGASDMARDAAQNQTYDVVT